MADKLLYTACAVVAMQMASLVKERSYLSSVFSSVCCIGEVARQVFLYMGQLEC